MAHLVWIIDDDPGILEVTQIVLEEAGFEVRKVDSENALEKNLHGRLPDVILLDILIAGIDGKDVAKRLKSDERTKHIPIIMMSADINLPEKAKEAGADDFLKKPYDIYELEKMVKSHVQKT